MSKEFDTLLDTLLRSENAQNAHNEAVGRYCDENTRQHAELWSDIGELRDEVVALANRLEALTHFVTTSPAEVAEKIILREPTIQGNVEQIVRDSDQPVTAGDVLAELPPDTKREAVNYALWRAVQKGKLLRLRHGVYMAGDNGD